MCVNLPSLVDRRTFGFDLIAFQGHIAGILSDANANLLPSLAGVFDDVVAQDGSDSESIYKHAPAFIVTHGVAFKSDAMSGHRLGFISPIDSTQLVSYDSIVADGVFAVLVTNRHAIAAVVLQQVAFGHTSAHSPAEEETILAILDGAAVLDRRTLRAAAWMESKTCTTPNLTAIDFDIVRLLKANPVAVVVANPAVRDATVVSPIEKDARRTAAIDLGGVVRAVPIDA